MYSLGMLSNRKKYIFWAAAIGGKRLSQLLDERQGGFSDPGGGVVFNGLAWGLTLIL